jgi:nucleotide-binding universal stress UspA family protein
MKHILVATDFSETAAAALREGAKLAALSGARLTLLHVVFAERFTEALLGLDALEYLAMAADQPHHDSGGALARLVEKTRQKLDETAAALPEPRPNIETAVTEGRPSSEIAAYASAHDVDLIVLGTHGRGGLGKTFLGSVVDHVIRVAECPVMVVRK